MQKSDHNNFSPETFILIGDDLQFSTRKTSSLNITWYYNLYLKHARLPQLLTSSSSAMALATTGTI